MTTDTDKTYFAALLDGEGYVCIRVCGTGDYQLLIAMSNVCPYPLQDFKHFYGGSLTKRFRSKDKNTNRRDIWQYQAVSNVALKALEDIYPFCRIKSKQVEIGIRFQRFKKFLSHENRKLLRDELQALNKRGKDGYRFD